MENKKLFGECLSEFIGCLIFILIGCGAVASKVLLNVDISQWEMSIIWGLAVMLAVYVTASVSGAHLNPAVTISLAIHRGFDKKKILPYIASQIAGCFTAAAIVYLVFNTYFTDFEFANNITRASYDGLATAGIFTTYPANGLNIIQAFSVEFIITMVLMITILALGEKSNTTKPGANLNPLILGSVIAIIGSSFGALTGFAMNPARDFGPKLFACIAGWGKYSFGQNMYFTVPIIAPILAAILAGYVYDKAIKKYLVEEA